LLACLFDEKQLLLLRQKIHEEVVLTREALMKLEKLISSFFMDNKSLKLAITL